MNLLINIHKPSVHRAWLCDSTSQSAVALCKNKMRSRSPSSAGGDSVVRWTAYALHG